MADVSIKYKGVVKAEMNASGTKTVKTAGKYCEGDIIIEYADPEKPTQSKTVTPTAAGFTVTPDSGKVLSSVQVNGDADLVAGNVKDGVNIFGVTGTLKSKETVTWHQCPEAVRNYLANVTYDPSDYSTTQINNYAPTPQVESNTKPIGKSVDGVTYYNEIPNVDSPFSSTNTAGTVNPLDGLRWINSVTSNMRDLGGWNCDGGKVKYGKIFRSGVINVADKELILNVLGIKTEIDLRDTEPHGSVFGNEIEYIDIDGTVIAYSINHSAERDRVWKEILSTIFDCAIKNKPVIFHCSAGRDRTGTVACVIEALLGVSQSDIDKDYELTCFALMGGTIGDPTRNKLSWGGQGGLIPIINAMPGNSFSNKVINWAASLGFTAAEINDFRSAMIDGDPATVSPTITNVSITNNLSMVSNDNAKAYIQINNEYSAKLTPDAGAKIGSVMITVAGSDVTPSVYKELIYPSNYGVITIPRLSGDLVITATGQSLNPYQFCEYIEATTYNDGSFIDLSYVTSETTGLDVKFSFSSIHSGGYGIAGNNDFAIGCDSSQDMRAYKGGIKSYQLSNSMTTNTQYFVSLNTNNDGKVYIDGVNKSWNSGTPAYSKNKSLYLFKVNTPKAAAHGSTVPGKIYSCNVFEAGVKVMALVPCYRTSDNACGMYDTLHDVFYAGTGSFSHGADVN